MNQRCATLCEPQWTSQPATKWRGFLPGTAIKSPGKRNDKTTGSRDRNPGAQYLGRHRGGNCYRGDDMEDDLTWLARNVHAWPSKTEKCMSSTPTGWIWAERIELGVGREVIVAKYESGFYTQEISKSQWLSRRAKLQNKPSWANAPEWATHLAQDGGGFTKGTWNWYSCKPDQMTISDVWTSDVPASSASIGEVLGDWRDTLERRPVDMSAPFVTERPKESTWFERGELPPVGIWCEASCDGAEPEKCKVIAYHKQQVAVQWSQFNHGCLDVLEMPGWAFRPIRSDRDKLIEVMKGTHAASLTNLDILASSILAAGFKRGEV